MIESPEPGAQVHQPVWIPSIHPMSGRRTYVLCNVIDRIVTYRERDELEAHFMLPAAPGSMKMSHEGDGIDTWP